MACKIVKMERYQKKIILSDLSKKMVLLAGPRQAGKTTLAKSCAQEFSKSLYLNYDSLEDRKIILEESWRIDVELLILDEIHKMDMWKNYLKGLFDTKKPHQKILVIGSAKLSNNVGDSLAGRYFLHRLLPLTPAECEKVPVNYPLDHFIKRGGFPEPFLFETDIEAERWRLQYVQSLLSSDVLDFENIQNLNHLRLVFELLRARVGSPVSYKSISEDVGISPNTVKKYIHVMEALYIIFRVTPFSHNISRSLLKEPKVYFFDTGLVKGDNGATFENLVALSLLKASYAKIDHEAKVTALHYVRTKDGKEVDFAIVEDNALQQLIEVKASHSSIDPNLRYFYEKYRVPKAIQVVKDLKRGRVDGGIEVIQGDNFLKSLYL